MTTLTNFLSSFYPDENEEIYLRAFKAKGSADAPDNRPIVEVVTRRRLATDAALQRMMAEANRTRGWYFVVNAGGNTDADIARFNAVFVESDNLPIVQQHRLLDAAPLPPSIRVETRKSIHAYWLLDGTCEAGDWRDTQISLINYFDGDKSIKNPSRVMRLPFFDHVHYDELEDKYEYTPVKLHTFTPQRRYSLEEVREAFPNFKSTVQYTSADARTLAFTSHEDRHCELIRRVTAAGQRKANGFIEARCPAHNGDGKSALFIHPTGAVKCHKGCDYFELLRSFGLSSERLPKNVHAASQNAPSDRASEIKLPKLPSKALYGLAGDIVRTIEPHTEADNAALLIQFLAAFGNLIGRSAYFCAEADFHYTKLSAVLVGASSKGRKGSSWGQIRRLLIRLDESFEDCIQDGLSSGEGLIHHVRDPQEKQVAIRERGKITGYQTEIVDEGATEKRAFILEPEFARVLQAMRREGNTLSSVIRQAWDSDLLRVMTKNPVRASQAHVSIVGHITIEELRRNLEETETANGFANRFLWIFTKRSKFLAEGGNLPESSLNSLVSSLAKAVSFARTITEIKRDEEARCLWIDVYPQLSSGHAGLFGSVTSRAEAQTMRLAMLYALLDCSSQIRREHLEAALALWQYAEDSARYIFGSATGDKLADEIFAALQGTGESGLTRTDISGLFKRNRSASEINRALRLLFETGKAQMKHEMADGAKRPTERWTVTCGLSQTYTSKSTENSVATENERNEIHEFNPPDRQADNIDFVNFVPQSHSDANVGVVSSESPIPSNGRLFTLTKPLAESSSFQPTNTPTYPCWKCTAACPSEATRCPNCEQDLSDLPF